MIIKPPKSGLGFGILGFGILDLVWLWLGCGNLGEKLQVLKLCHPPVVALKFLSRDLFTFLKRNSDL